MYGFTSEALHISHSRFLFFIFSDMVCAHNTFVQGINAMVYHARKIKEDQVKDFMIFAACIVSLFYIYIVIRTTNI